MVSSLTFLRILAPLALAGPMCAQAAPAVPADPAAWRVPIHSSPTADAEGGAYGVWAGGRSFKASFGDHFVFYPILGSGASRHLPLGWRTASVRAGGRELLRPSDQPARWHSDWRFEYRYPAFTEAYDILAEGVEQSFVFAERPGPGDLVVEGEIKTPLEVATSEDGCRSLVFRTAEGRAIIDYGAAFAVDAAGRRAPVSVGCDGRRIVLRVGAAWLDRAEFPVTIDPLTSRSALTSWSGNFGRVGRLAIGREGESATRNTLLLVSRQAAQGDWDAFGWIMDDGFRNPRLVFSDITTSWETKHPSVAFVGGADRWVLAFERWFAAPTSRVCTRVYLHDKGSTALNRGTMLMLSCAVGRDRRHPEVGGTKGDSNGSRALLVFEEDRALANTPSTNVRGVFVDAARKTLGTMFDIGSGSNRDREWPHVNQVSGGGSEHWMVVWQERDNAVPGDDWDLLTRGVRPNGTLGGWARLDFETTFPRERIRPRIAGAGGRYLVSFVRARSTSSGFGEQIVTQRFDWFDPSVPPTLKEIRTLRLTTVLANGDVAFDSSTRSHWAIAYQRFGDAIGDVYVARVGSTGSILEQGVMYTGPNGAYSPSVAFCDDRGEFVIAYASTDSRFPVYGQRLVHDPTARNVLYGTGCGGRISASPPYSGSQFWTVRLSGAAPRQNAALLLSLYRGSFDLTSMGLPGCFLNIDDRSFWVFDTPVTTSAGTASSIVPLPDSTRRATLRWQWMYVDPAAPRTLKASLTRGLESRIRP